MNIKNGFYLMAFLSFGACASLQDLAEKTFEKPDVSVAGVKLTHLSFDDVGLAFNLNVSNPNRIGVTLAGYDYDLQLNQASVLQGNQTEGLKIEANGISQVDVPVTLQFRELYQTLANLKNQGEAEYLMKLGLSFDVPLLGMEHRVPVEHHGKFPLPKLPKIGIASLKLNSLNLSGAQLVLNVKVENPNTFDFALKRLKYTFAVAGTNWLEDQVEQVLSVGASSEGILRFPISLSFFKIGQSVFALLNKSEPVDYAFKGDFEIDTSIPELGAVALPFEHFGEVAVQK